MVAVPPKPPAPPVALVLPTAPPVALLVPPVELVVLLLVLAWA